MENKPSNFKTAFHEKSAAARAKIWAKKSARVRLHRSFRLSHHEDYDRPLAAPGLLAFSISVFKMIFKNWKFFSLLLICAVIFNTILVGLMNESTYKTFQETLDETNNLTNGGSLGSVAKAGLVLISTIATGGLSTTTSAVQQVFAILIFIIIWLVVIWSLRHFLAGNRPKFRDALYNSLSPFLSTLIILANIFIQLIPVFVVMIAYSAAVETDFLSTPLYALIFFICAVPLILLSCYLLSGSVIALVAVSAPGIYPLVALNTASDLQQGRRIRFIIRLFFLIFVLAVLWILIMLPLILFDDWLKTASDSFAGWPIIPLFMNLMTCFSFIYISCYLYLFYRRLLDDPN
jgi:hypothetical protein